MDERLHLKERGEFYSWHTIEQSLDTFVDTEGGFSPANRGLVRLPTGAPAFVKIGVDNNTKLWAQKEVAAYELLHKANYPYIPRLLAHSHDSTAFAIEALTPEHGWDWSNTWDVDRLETTLVAMDQLATLDVHTTDQLNIRTLGSKDEGWQQIVGSADLRKNLLFKLNTARGSHVANSLDLEALSDKCNRFTFGDDLVHNDVRADNCAWNPHSKSVRLVDWNWLQRGDRRIDINSLLVHVHRSGFDVTKHQPKRLNTDALQWMAGFWLKAAATPIWPGGPAHLRDIQLEAGIVALELAAWKARRSE